MKKTLLGLTLTGAVALTSANAADMYVPGPAGPSSYKDCCGPIWTGWYIGVNGGYGWSEHSDQLLDPALINLGYHGLSPSGGFGGGQIGYNWQGIWDPNLVLGVEADIQGADIKDSKVILPGVPFETTSFESRLDFFGTVRGRLGYAFGSSLLYATGGFAYGGVHNEEDGFLATKGGIFPVAYKFNGTATGYAAGGGYEYKVNPAWSLKVEYQYINLGTNNMTANFQSHILGACNLDRCEDDAFHTVRAGLNYHFGTGYVPLK
jgi:outer membrane immunogenic protein